MWRASIVRRFLLAVVPLMLFMNSVLATEKFRVVTDTHARIKIGIPESFPHQGKPTKWGHTWASVDGGIAVNSLAFAHGRTIEDVYAGLTAVKGRVFSRNARTSNQFTLQGRDADGSGFYIAAVSDDVTVRGVSIIYTETRKREYAGMVEQIARSFELIQSQPASDLRGHDQARVHVQTSHASNIRCMHLGEKNRITATSDASGFIKLWGMINHRLLITLPPQLPLMEC